MAAPHRSRANALALLVLCCLVSQHYVSALSLHSLAFWQRGKAAPKPPNFPSAFEARPWRVSVAERWRVCACMAVAEHASEHAAWEHGALTACPHTCTLHARLRLTRLRPPRTHTHLTNPTTRQASYTFTLPYVQTVQTLGLSFPVCVWYDGSTQRLRTDVYGGLDSTLTAEVCLGAAVLRLSNAASPCVWHSTHNRTPNRAVRGADMRPLCRTTRTCCTLASIVGCVRSITTTWGPQRQQRCPPSCWPPR
jgi:hypothetical protein